MNKRRLVINILTNNRISELCICLTSLINQSFQDWDLVIIDDHSTKDCREYKFFNDLIGRIKSDAHGLIIYRHDVPWLDIGKARNHCVELSKTFPHNTCEFICRVDDDSLLDKDYIKKLYEVISVSKDDVAAVGGVVPVLGNPNLYLKVPKVFNEVKWDMEGNITSMGDDGGVDYHYKEEYIDIWDKEKSTSKIPTIKEIQIEPKPIQSHHLRSSFMFKTSVHDIEPHPIEYGPTGYREESDLTIRWTLNGYKLLTDVSAVCYHQQARSGGARLPGPQYKEQARMNDEHFRAKMKYLFNKKGGIKL